MPDAVSSIDQLMQAGAQSVEAPPLSSRAQARQLMANVNQHRPLSLSPLVMHSRVSHRRVERGRRDPRRVALAMGVVVMLTSGGAWWTAQSLSGTAQKSGNGASEAEVVTPLTQSPVPPPSIPGLPTGSARWAAQMQAALVSVTAHLRKTTSAEQAWNALPASRRAQPPIEVTALHAQRGDLVRQQTGLSTVLKTWRRLNTAHQALVQTEAQLSKVTLTQESAEQLRSPRSAGARYAVLLDRAQSQRQIVVGLIPLIHAAMADPIPVVSDAAAPTATAVLAVTHSRAGAEPAGSSAADSHPTRIEAAAGPTTQTEIGSSLPTMAPAPPAPAPVTGTSRETSTQQLAEAQRLTRQATRSAQQLLSAMGGY
jgi:hypothetical protein